VTRLALGALVGLAVGVVVGAALSVRADETPSEETIMLAAEAGVDPWDLAGAANTTGLSPADYLAHVDEWIAVGESPNADGGLAHGWPGVGGARSYIASHSRYPARALCVAAMESGFNGQAWNPQPWGRWAEHAAGYFGWLGSTAASVGVRIGDLASEVAGFDEMMRRGRGNEFAGVAWRIC
jgi:hypothetical protein